MKNLRGHLLCLVIFAVPLFVWPGWGDSIREPKYYLLLTAGLILGALQWRRPRQALGLWRSAPASFLLLFLYIAVQSLALRPPLPALTDIALFFAAMSIALEFVENTDLPLLDSCMRWLTFVNIGYGIMQIIGYDPIFEYLDPSLRHTATGFMGHRTLYGPLMVMLMGYQLAHRRYVTAGACLLMALAARSAMTIFSAVTCLMALLWLRRHYKAIALLFGSSALFGTLGFIYRAQYSFFSDKGRFLAWRLATGDAMERPFFGHGFNTFPLYFARRYQLVLGLPWQQAHQELIQAFFELGLVGVFIVVWMFIDFVYNLRERIISRQQEAWFFICVAGLADSMANFPLHIAPLALFTLCGWLLTSRQDVASKTISSSASHQ